MNKIPYDDSKTGGYSYPEKLALVAKGAMDPKEIGLTDANEAKLVITGQKPPQVTGGTAMVFRAATVPIEVRAHWAFTELRVRPLNPESWKTDWIEAHKNDNALIQGEVRVGTTGARLETLAADPVLGLIAMLRMAGDQIEKKYSAEKATAVGIAAATPGEIVEALETVDKQIAKELGPTGPTGLLES